MIEPDRVSMHALSRLVARADADQPLADLPNPHHEPQVDAATKRTARDASVLILIREWRDHRLEVLLTRRAAGLRFAGNWCFPGGHAEDREDALQTALRETHEEVGVSADVIEPIGAFGRYFTHHGYAITPIIAKTSTNIRLNVDPGEVADTRWLSLDALLDSRTYRLEKRQHIDGSYRANFALYHGDVRVSGPTLSLLIHLGRLLEIPCALPQSASTFSERD